MFFAQPPRFDRNSRALRDLFRARSGSGAIILCRDRGGGNASPWTDRAFAEAMPRQGENLRAHKLLPEVRPALETRGLQQIHRAERARANRLSGRSALPGGSSPAGFFRSRIFPVASPTE